MGRCNGSKGGIRSVRKAWTELGSVALIIEGTRGVGMVLVKIGSARRMRGELRRCVEKVRKV
jgi:hypothetical protein